MDKQCNHCKKVKPLGEFFSAPESGAAAWNGTSEYCKTCHDAGLIKYGYGFYVEQYTDPNWRLDVMTSKSDGLPVHHGEVLPKGVSLDMHRA